MGKESSTTDHYWGFSVTISTNGRNDGSVKGAVVRRRFDLKQHRPEGHKAQERLGIKPKRLSKGDIVNP